MASKGEIVAVLESEPATGASVVVEKSMRRSRPRTPAHAKRLRVRRKKHRSLTDAQWAEIKRIFHQRCAYCGIVSCQLQRDCVLPGNRMGIYVMFNIAPACASCNGKKGSKNVFAWMRREGFDTRYFELKMQEVWQAWLEN